jgi:hypothetical protein
MSLYEKWFDNIIQILAGWGQWALIAGLAFYGLLVIVGTLLFICNLLNITSWVFIKLFFNNSIPSSQSFFNPKRDASPNNRPEVIIFRYFSNLIRKSMISFYCLNNTIRYFICIGNNAPKNRPCNKQINSSENYKKKGCAKSAYYNIPKVVINPNSNVLNHSHADKSNTGETSESTKKEPNHHNRLICDSEDTIRVYLSLKIEQL